MSADKPTTQFSTLVGQPLPILSSLGQLAEKLGISDSRELKAGPFSETDTVLSFSVPRERFSFPLQFQSPGKRESLLSSCHGIEAGAPRGRRDSIADHVYKRTKHSLKLNR